MDLQLKVLVRSRIKRKKAWSRLAWIGKQKESVCLIDSTRASVLYLPSGRTKRTIDVLKPHKNKIICINYSQSGEYTMVNNVKYSIMMSTLCQ